MNTRNYPGVKADVPQLINELRNLFDDDNYEVQTRQEPFGIVLQARKSSRLRDWTGFSYALTIKITPEETGTSVALGQHKWLDKVAVVTVASFVAGPLVLVPAFGAYKQYKIAEDAWNVIEKHMARKSGGTVFTPTVCSSCSAVSTGARYCSNCGTELT